jgi:NAD(P)H-flavin reductase
MYTAGGVVGLLTILQVGTFWYRNKRLGYQYPRMSVKQSNGSILATIYMSRPLHLDAGQYINIWVPSISLLSSHPFTVVSWSPKPQAVVDLFIEKRDGFTSQLLRRAERQHSPSLTTRVFFSGPHGRSVRVWGFDYVLLFASGYGIVATLPYLQKLIYGRKERRSRTRRIHVVWHVNNLRTLPCATERTWG